MRTSRPNIIGVGAAVLIGGVIVLLLWSGSLRLGLAPAAGGSAGSEPTLATARDPQVEPSPAPSLVPTAEPSSQGSLADLQVSTAGWRTDFTRSNVDLGEIIGGGPGKDGIPAVDEPRLESIEAAATWLSDQAPVIALEVDGEARAYPLAILIWHEIVNDTIAGAPVVVTFCPLCNTALVFERTVDGVTSDFGTTGNLRFSDLVMYDRQTETWWQQATGRAIVGELTDTQLVFLASQIVSLGDFADAYPGGTVLSRDTGNPRDYGRNPYPGYDRADQEPFLFEGVVDGRIAPKERVVTVELADEAVAYPYSELRKVGLVTEQVGGEPIVVLWEPGTASALDAPVIDEGQDAGGTGVFRPEVDGRSLTLRRDSPDAPIVDNETGSTWDVTGGATDGPLEGTRLELIPHGDHFWFAWAAFEPSTRIWTADGAHTAPVAGSASAQPAPAPSASSQGLVGRLPAQIAGLLLDAAEIDVARLLTNDLPIMDLDDLRSVVTQSGVSPERFEIATGTATDGVGAKVTITAFRDLGGSPSRLRLAVERAAGTLSPLGFSEGDHASSRVLLLGDVVYLITSADLELLAAAAEALTEEGS